MMGSQVEPIMEAFFFSFPFVSSLFMLSHFAIAAALGHVFSYPGQSVCVCVVKEGFC